MNCIPPAFDFLCGRDDRGDAAGVHLHEGHMGHRVRGKERRASVPGSLHVPAGETQLETLGVM